MKMMNLKCFIVPNFDPTLDMQVRFQDLNLFVHDAQFLQPHV